MCIRDRIWKERDSAQPRLLETILYKDNFNRAYKRVKANKGDVYKRQDIWRILFADTCGRIYRNDVLCCTDNAGDS